MNEKVENLIKQEKERLETSEKQMRKNHLISIGLIDENKTERRYIEDSKVVPIAGKYDKEQKKFYIEKPFAIDVSDDEYQEICKYFPPEKEEFISKTNAENILNVMSIVTLVCGIIGTLICLFTIAFVFDRYGFDKFSPVGLVIAIGVLITSLVTYAILKVIREISINLRQINNKTK